MLAGRPLHFPTRKAEALLIYLVVEGGLHAREHLIALFWPESDARRGRAALRNTLVRLREALAPAWSGEGPPGTLITEGDRLGFEPGAGLALDLAALDEALLALRSGTAAPAALLPVRDACRGDFLDGFSLDDAPSFDDWASAQRERWHQRLAAFFDQLSELQTKTGDLTGAVESAQRWVAHDPLSEAAARRLMQGLFAIGDREAALRAYQAIRATLQAELSAEPASETELIYERLRGPALPLPPARRGAARPRRLAALEAPLVGRAVQLAEMMARYRLAADGQALALVIEGEAGIGKSRLADEFLRWATAQGAVVLAGRAFETGGRLPFQALVEALRPRLASVDLLKLAGERRVAALSRLLPELRDRYPGLPVPAGDDLDARPQLFEAVAHVIQALAGRAPLVLYVDDLQWVDTASLDMLRHQARRLAQPSGGLPALLVLTVRSESLSLSPELAEWLAGLARDLPVFRLGLAPLGEAETREWLQAFIGAEADPAFVRWLYADTQGHPFYVAETLKALVERGVLVSIGSGDDGWALKLSDSDARLGPGGWMPAGVRQVIRARLAQLSAEAMALLGAGAVLGQRLSFERLLRVAGLTEADGLRGLDELLARRLLVESNDPQRPYQFAHDKIRDVAYTEAGAARRRIFHRRAFELLERSSAPAPELSHHALAAGLGLPAFHWSLLAGDDALRLFAAREAVGHYRRAEQVLMEQAELRESLELEQQAHLYLQAGRAYELLNDWVQARAAYEALLAMSRSARDTARQCTALNRLATIAAWNAFDMPLAESLLAEACTLAERTGDRAGLAETEWNLATLGTYRADPAALAHARRALSLARELDRPELVARALNAVAHAASGTGQWDEIRATAEEAATLFHKLHNRPLEADSLALAADALSNQGQLQAGLASARTAYAISQEIENAWGQVFSAFQLSLILGDMGEYGEALGLARRSRELAAGLGFPNLLFLNLMSLSILELLIGQFEAAEAHLQQAATLNEQAGNLRPYAEAVSLLNCVLLGAQGRWSEALIPARQVVALHDAAFMMSASVPAWVVVEALGRASERQAALAYSESFGRGADPSPRLDLTRQQILAALARTQGAHDEALAHLAAAAELAERLGLPGEQWLIAVEQSALYSAERDSIRAAAAAGQAARLRAALAERLADPELRAVFLNQDIQTWVK
jgi:DNA-binding SARP family transcriptional activator